MNALKNGLDQPHAPGQFGPKQVLGAGWAAVALAS